MVKSIQILSSPWSTGGIKTEISSRRQFSRPERMAYFSHKRPISTGSAVAYLPEIQHCRYQGWHSGCMKKQLKLMKRWSSNRDLMLSRYPLRDRNNWGWFYCLRQYCFTVAVGATSVRIFALPESASTGLHSFIFQMKNFTKKSNIILHFCKTLQCLA